MLATPVTTVEGAIDRLRLRSEIAYDAFMRVNRQDFCEQAEAFDTIADLLERLPR